jgi:tetratricopeptide (TPR) repeat protein
MSRLQWMVIGAMLALGSGAQASMTVLGDNGAQECFQAVEDGQASFTAESVCTSALGDQTLLAHDRAGTYINRGVIRMRMGDFKGADADFHAGIDAEPNIGEAWVNLGALRIQEHKFKEAVENIDKGLNLGVKYPEKAYYNRALAYEQLDDDTNAYLDFQQALVIRPGWDLPTKELLRFSVRRKPAAGS